MKFIKILPTVLVLFFTTLAVAKFKMPAQMNAGDRTTALQILGPATSNRLLSTSYPLGGSHGFEVSLSHHYVPCSYLSELGDKSGSTQDYEYPMVTMGKGLFYNLDLFLSFVPMTQNDFLDHFSTQLRYQFWQSESQLFRLSSLIYAGTSTLNNQMTMQSYGYDIVGTTTIDRVSLFVGVGTSFNNGRFIGGFKGITDSLNTETVTATLAHQLIGVEWPIDDFFIAGEVDRYKIPYYSVKAGYRL
jgi:hypothetical protein